MAAAFIIGLAMGAAGLSPDSAVGRWRTETRSGIVDIQKCGTSICGRLVTSEKLRTDPALKDLNNKDASLRNRPLRGLLLLSGFLVSREAWTGGIIYNAEDGKTYKATVTPVGPDQLKVRGCIFMPLCKTQTWTRIQ